MVRNYKPNPRGKTDVKHSSETIKKAWQIMKKECHFEIAPENMMFLLLSCAVATKTPI